MRVLSGRKFLLGSFLGVIITAQTIVRRRPVDYVNPLIGRAPMTNKEYLGNNPAPGEELYSGTVNPVDHPKDSGHSL